MLNKFSIRKYLDQNLNFKNISPKKNIFKPSYLKYEFNKSQVEIASDFNIQINKLNIMQKSDFYFWSKYLINNEINYDIN